MARSKKQPATTFEKTSEADAANPVTHGAPARNVPQDSPSESAPDTAPPAPTDAPAELPTEPALKRGRKPRAKDGTPGSTAAAATSTTATSTTDTAQGPVTSAAAGLTMRGLSDGFIASLQKRGAGLGTVFSYHLDLNLAVRHFGADGPVASLTPRRIENYFTSDALCKTKSGRQKATPGIAKSRRVLRLALDWAVTEGLIAESPVPESARPRAKKSDDTAT